MAQPTERRVLNYLIETCKDGERGFRLAANHVTTQAVKTLFEEAASQREQFAADLLPYAQRLGGDADTGGTAAGTLHRGWMTLKDAFMHYDEKAILTEAERGETAAVAAYEDALQSIVPPTVRDVLETQLAAILKMQDRIQSIEKTTAAA